MKTEALKKFGRTISKGVKKTILALETVAAPITTHAVKTGSKPTDPELWMAVKGDVLSTAACLAPAYLYLFPYPGEPVNRLGASIAFLTTRIITSTLLHLAIPYMDGSK